MAEESAKPSYKKRVIAEDSSDEEAQVPLAKRLKEEESSAVLPATAPAAASIAQEKPAVVAEKKVDVFTTGNSDDDDDESSSEDDKPLKEAAMSMNGTSTTNGKRAPSTVATPSSSSDDDDVPLAKKARKATKAKAPSKGKGKKKAKRDDSDDDDDDFSESEDEKPLAKRKKAAAKKSKATEKKAPAARKPKKEASASVSPVKKKGKQAKSEQGSQAAGSGDEGEDVYAWWEEEQNGETKWQTLEHNGVLFPPPYEPHGVKMLYDGKPITLPPESEEVASFFAAILETDYVKNPVFVKNFFDDWQEVLAKHPPAEGVKIDDYDRCDFRPIFNFLEGEKAKKKAKTNAEKKLDKVARDALEEPYKFCLWNGRKQKVGNFRIEPPGLFRGRGEHPKTGKLKRRVQPEQITINIGKDAEAPTPPPGHKWRDVIHDDKVSWLATWKENINNNVKYVFLAANSAVKGRSDLAKFEKARALKAHVDKIRRDYTADLKSKEMAVRQRATAVYLIDRFALRAGNEKGEDEADTVGCCSLRFEHVTLAPPNRVTFDFLGKDSIRYVNEVEVDDQVFKNMKLFKKEPKEVGDLLFDRLTTSMVNKYLNSYMEGLTAKVFRTYNASWTFAQQLKTTPTDVSTADKILAYNRANRLVAILCNHQRSVPKGHGAAMEKLTDKLRALKYQRRKLRKQLLANAEKPKSYKQYQEDESDIDDEWIVKHEADLVVQEREKIKKKFAKENEKRLADDEKPLDDSELEERLKLADELEKTLRKERKAGWKESKLSEDRLVKAIEKIDDRIKVQRVNVTDRDENKEISLGTSKINYIDPRITVAWCKKNDVPVNKLLSKTLLEKFQWATFVDADFEW